MQCGDDVLASGLGRFVKNSIHMEPLLHFVSAQRKCKSADRRCRAGLVLVVLCSLVSCVASSPKKVDSAPAATPAAQNVPASAVTFPELSKDNAVAREHLQNAINALQLGQEANAKKELDVVLRNEPDNKVARSLLAQINIDPSKYFSSQEAFNYTLQSGDTLTSIAQRFLDEPLKFHILARLNGITDPIRLAPGRVIKVPGKKAGSVPASVVAEDSHRAGSARGGDEPRRVDVPPARAETARDDGRTLQARRLYDTGKYQQAIETLAGSGAGNNEARDLLALAYGKYAEELVQNDNLLDAQSVLENALSLQPGNDKLRKQLKQVQKQREVARLYKAGTESMVAGDNDKALDTFNALLKLEPKHEATQQHIASINAFAVEAMHKDAMVEYGKQNLDQAISLWDRVLAMLPSHANAKLYRARAVDLKSRLLKLDQKSSTNID